MSMRYVVAIAAALIAMTVQAPSADAQRTSTILIYGPPNSRDLVLRVTAERQQLRTQSQTTQHTQHFTIYRHVLSWPVLGRRQRNDFSVHAKIAAVSRTFYLRLRPSDTPVEIYIFNRPNRTQCRWREPRIVTTPWEIYQELAEAEAVLLIQNQQGRCPEVQLRQWTRRWAQLTLRLWAQTEAIGLDRDVLTAIQWAHAVPKRPLLSLASGPASFPSEYYDVIRAEQQLAAKFR